jgi:hypothetical protein
MFLPHKSDRRAHSALIFCFDRFPEPFFSGSLGGDIGISEVAWLNEFHAASLSSLSASRATILITSSGNGSKGCNPLTDPLNFKRAE